VNLDSQFAVGYLNVGAALNNAGLSTAAHESFTAAFKLHNRATRRSRYFIDEYYYESVTGEMEKAENTLLEWQRAYPYSDNEYLLYTLSRLHRQMGRYELAASEAEEFKRNNPDDLYSYFGLLQSYTALNRLEEARKASDEARARNVDGPILRLERYFLALRQQDNAAIQDQLEWAQQEHNSAVFWAQSDTEAFYGHFRKAREISASAIELSGKAGPEVVAVYTAQMAVREAEVGNVHLAQRNASEALAISQAEDPKMLAAIALARSRDPRRSYKLANEISVKEPLNTLTQNYWKPTIEAAVALDDSPLSGIAGLEAARPYELSNYNFIDRPFGDLYPIYMRGLCYLKAAQADRAGVEFQKILDHPGIVGNFIIGALAHLQLARAQVMMGDKEAARKSYQDFLTLWKDADPDIPIYRQAKAEYAKLR
jgi:tetratricopeptide (TPR) repeat protein